MGTKIIEGVLEVTERGTTENSIIRSGDLATTTQAGLMSTTDKENLDTLVNSFNSDDANTTIDTIKEVLKAFENAPEATNIANALANKVDKNTEITGASKCKITYDNKGLVTGGTDLVATDIPDLNASKITDGTFADDRIASAQTWHDKQDAITDLETIRNGANAGATAVQSGDLATVATSGSYNDLTNQPTVNGVALSGVKTSTDLKVGLVSSSGGFQAGDNATANNGGAVGNNAVATSGGAVGLNAITTTGFAGGQGAESRYAADGQTKITGAVAIGPNAKAQADDAVQIGFGVNTTENTLQFRNYQLLDANGKIPTDRLDLATVATSGNYNDLSNLPEPAVTQAVIEGDGILT